jgi:hypothetical protein
MIDIGMYPDLDNEEYHQDEGSVSRSGLMEFNRSPYHYWARYINPSRPPKEMTDAMMFGKAFHEFILEPEQFKKHFVCKPPRVLLKNVGRAMYDAYKAQCEELENTNMIVLDDEDFLRLNAMKEALLAYPEARELLEGGIVEQSYFWRDEDSGLMLKARPDIVHPNLIVDLKTCADASRHAFQRSIVDGGYHIQGAMVREARSILEGRMVNNVINIAIETKYPYAIGVYIIGEYSLEVGEAKFKELSLDLSTAIGHNIWRNYEVQTIDIPKWAL